MAVGKLVVAAMSFMCLLVRSNCMCWVPSIKYHGVHLTGRCKTLSFNFERLEKLLFAVCYCIRAKANASR